LQLRPPPYSTLFPYTTLFRSQLPLEFDGFIKLLEAGQQYDLTFKTPTSSLKNLLALIPAEYSGSIENVQTSGNFAINGFAKGNRSEEHMSELQSRENLVCRLL